MSGGHFNYAFSSINMLVEQLEMEIENNNSKEIDRWGDKIGEGFKKPTIRNLKQTLGILKLASNLAKDIEWLYSGDTGEETFNETFKRRVEDK